MPDSTQPPGRCHNRHEALMFAGIISQHLPAEMTAAEMEAWRHDPEGLAAVLAGLLPAPKLAEGHATAPLHVGAPPRSLSAGLNGTSASDLGVGTEFDARAVAAAVIEQADEHLADHIDAVGRGDTLPMLPSLNGPHTAESVRRLRDSTTRTKGAELPDED
jgi:hypothetical protein